MDVGRNEAAIGIGVGAVVFRGGEALVIRRGRPPFLGQWSIPGGKPHHGERLEDALRREVLEEAGVQIRIGGLIGVFEAIPEAGADDGLTHMVLVDYWAEWIEGEPVAGDDALAAEFVPVEEALRRVSWDLTRTAIAGAVKLRNTVNNPP